MPSKPPTANKPKILEALDNYIERYKPLVPTRPAPSQALPTNNAATVRSPKPEAQEPENVIP